MRPAAGWLLGTVLFAAALILADRAFWASCGGLPTQRYGEVWLCSNALALRVAAGCAAGFLAGLAAGRHGLLVGAHVALAGLVAVSLGYRPLVAYNQLAGIAGGVALFVLPPALACALGAKLAGASWRRALL